jgi:hypothetical protein
MGLRSYNGRYELLVDKPSKELPLQVADFHEQGFKT